MKIRLNEIRLDGGTQPRSNINQFAVSEYADEMRSGALFPDVILFYDGLDFWLADGFHRVRAAIEAGLSAINADVRQGTRRDALLFSVGANTSQGMRRTREDERRAALTLLNDKEWRKWSDEEIARQCGVSVEMVRALRPPVFQHSDDGSRLANRNGVAHETKSERLSNTARLA
jgi:hypothetical protein